VLQVIRVEVILSTPMTMIINKANSNEFVLTILKRQSHKISKTIKALLKQPLENFNF